MTRCGLLLRIKLLSSSSQGLLGTRSAMRKGCRVVSFTTPESVPAGTAQLVFEVQGHIPTGLADFAGDVSFVLEGEEHHLIEGSGRVHGDRVRFHQKDMAANGKDVRVWGIRQEGNAFLAEPTPSF